MLKDTTSTKKKILIVDDERGILSVLSIKLRVSGYYVVTAASLAQGSLRSVVSLGAIVMTKVAGLAWI